MAKRTATSELNHDNWDRDEEPEDAGTFAKASEDALKKRIIKVAKRRNPISSSQNEEDKPSAFGGFSGFGKAATLTPSPSSSSKSFGFLSNLANKTESTKTNGTPEKPVEKSEKNLDEYYAKLKGLNESVTEWIKKHVNANPFINLQPIFKDYDKFITDLEKLKSETVSNKSDSTNMKFNFAPASTTSQFVAGSSPKFSFGATSVSTTSFSGQATTESKNSSKNSFSNTTKFSFGKPQTSGDNKFTFTSTVIKPADDNKTSNAEEDQEEEPPKAEFTPVVEEGHVYTNRCKVFVKKDSNYVDHGVGTLYLKPVPNSEKVQLFVRADTNLGNLICNFILSEAIPTQRVGKRDVMLVCIPSPQAKPPPVPILLRVKSAEEADELLKTLEKHKK